MQTRTTTLTRLTLTAVIALGATACASGAPAVPAAEPAAVPPVASRTTAAAPPAAAPTPGAPASVPGGIPPTPDAATTAKYIAALTAIDPEIVDKKPDRAVSRGRDQCTSIGTWPNDRQRLLDLTGQRFTSSKHPDGFGPEKASLILDVVHANLCPTY
ncbi:hypothetical protein OG689_31015 [Kitasatospora sp. NBC_00240]|uniref:hypothetical protein n=1 Tax=Kitasatospora sp. NBC_00240 TaxID=2903567 RepID=UPI002258DB72|nr:hypothetical protein [Kitasatospora sp. NBC_00240]MCX5213649.1 hypothetical protein [Kitasatospora sp. NBC_00240]